VRTAYHVGAHWNERVGMAQWWSDYLDTLRDGAALLAFPTCREVMDTRHPGRFR
jgi:hypothetical protein